MRVRFRNRWLSAAVLVVQGTSLEVGAEDLLRSADRKDFEIATNLVEESGSLCRMRSKVMGSRLSRK